AARQVYIDAPSTLHLELGPFVTGEKPGIDLRILMDQQGPVSAIRRDDEPQPAPLLLRRKAFLLVARLDIALCRLDPDLQKMHRLARARIELAVPHARAGTHSLHITGPDGR